MMRYKVFKGNIFGQKGTYIFKLSIFAEKLSNITSFPEYFYCKFISDPDPATSFGFIRIHNTAYAEGST